MRLPQTVPISQKKGQPSSKEEYHLSPHDNGWQLKKADGQRAIMVEETKDKSCESQRLCEEHSGTLVVHKQDGSVEDQPIST